MTALPNWETLSIPTASFRTLEIAWSFPLAVVFTTRVTEEFDLIPLTSDRPRIGMHT